MCASRSPPLSFTYQPNISSARFASNRRHNHHCRPTTNRPTRTSHSLVVVSNLTPSWRTSARQTCESLAPCGARVFELARLRRTRPTFASIPSRSCKTISVRGKRDFNKLEDKPDQEHDARETCFLMLAQVGGLFTASVSRTSRSSSRHKQF